MTDHSDASVSNRTPVEDEALEGNVSTLEEKISLLSVTVRRLVAAGATGKRGTDAQKWEVGDTINALDALAGRARRGRPPQAPAKKSASLPRRHLSEIRDLREELVSGEGLPPDQRIARSALVDYARVAGAVPPTDRLREYPLGFFFARALSVVENPDKRLEWADRVVREKLSVGRLRAALNASRGGVEAVPGNAPETSASPPSLDPSTGETRRGVYVCAQTGLQITDLGAMAEVKLDRSHPAAPKHLPRRNKHVVLRFKDLDALAEWIEESHLDGEHQAQAHDTGADG